MANPLSAFRLPYPIVVRLRRAAERQQVTFSEFVRQAIEEKLDRMEDREIERRKARKGKEDDAPTPGGLFGDRRPSRAEVTIEAEPAPQTVVVQNAPPSDDQIVKRLAKMVTIGANWSRPKRLQDAVRILKESADTATEAERLVKALDVEIAALDRLNAGESTTSVPATEPTKPTSWLPDFPSLLRRKP